MSAFSNSRTNSHTVHWFVIFVAILLTACSSETTTDPVADGTQANETSNIANDANNDSNENDAETAANDASEGEKNQPPKIHLENYQTLLAEAFFVINGGRPLTTVREFNSLLEYRRIKMGTDDDSPTLTSIVYDKPTVFDCENGGTLSGTQIGVYDTSYTFDNCKLWRKPFINHGSVVAHASKYGTSNRYEDMRSLTTDGVLISRVTGFNEEQRPNTPICGGAPTYTREYEYLYLTQGQGNYTVTNALTKHRLIIETLDPNADCSTFIDSYFNMVFESVVSDDLGFDVDVSTPTPFSGANGAITDGIMLIEAKDGSAVKVGINKDGSNTIFIEVLNDERTDTFTESMDYLKNSLKKPCNSSNCD